MRLSFRLSNSGLTLRLISVLDRVREPGEERLEKSSLLNGVALLQTSFCGEFGGTTAIRSEDRNLEEIMRFEGAKRRSHNSVSLGNPADWCHQSQQILASGLQFSYYYLSDCQLQRLK